MRAGLGGDGLFACLGGCNCTGARPGAGSQSPYFEGWRAVTMVFANKGDVCSSLRCKELVVTRQLILPSRHWGVSAQSVRPLLEGHWLVRTVVAPLSGQCAVDLSPSGGTSAGPYTSINIAVPPLGCQRAAGLSPSGGTPAGLYIRWVVGLSPSGGTPPAEQVSSPPVHLRGLPVGVWGFHP